MSEQHDPKKTEVHPLDEELRRAFKNLIEEDLPDRFGDLLNQLRRGEVPSDNAAEKTESDPGADD